MNLKGVILSMCFVGIIMTVLPLPPTYLLFVTKKIGSLFVEKKGM